MTDTPSDKPNYKDTVFLPQTPFPMKAGLPAQEPKWLDLWRDLDLYNRLRRERASQPKFVLHDGPPYANGDIHIGHALNKILKDVVVRSQSMLGKNAPYVPGWDCHGLPIEWKIEEKYRAAKKNKDEVPVIDFRAECRAFAAHWVGVQSEQFQRLGVTGDWQDPYKTMNLASEAAIAREIHKFLMNGGLYRAAMPVMWSTVEKTALAEAEVEYHDHTSTAIHVAFPVVKTSSEKLNGAKIVIWTTTPWTIPANRAIAYGDFDYVLVKVISKMGETQDISQNLTFSGQEFVVAKELLDSFAKATGLVFEASQTTIKSSELEGTICAHPLRGQGYDFDVPLLPGDHVTTETGTGFVHTAPSHGADDYQLGLKYNLPVPELVLGDGRYADNVPLFAGEYVITPYGKEGGANQKVIDKLKEVGALVAEAKITHSYPHSWRSKAPIIFRATPQWFISMETNGLRDRALQAISDTTWFPAAGENRIRSMVANRPDWCISRQRTWGVPIAIFVNKATNEVLRDEAVCARIQEAFEKDSADAWYTTDPQVFLGNKYKAEDYEQVFDIVDVWFESGSTHAFVLEARPELQWPADLYLEGSDQHRGWFHSSLLESCGTRGRAPYNAVVTHGFTMDEKGRKMSKSVGNVIAPETMIKEYGADILRLWALTSNYAEDNKIGNDIMKQTAELYRKIRNTLRYILGGLDGFSDSERLSYEHLPELEQYALHLIANVDREIRAGIESYDFTSAINALHTFCTNDLSAFYFDVRKDTLYCDGKNSHRRRASRTLLDTLYTYLTAWLAPFLCFTAEEAWQARGRTDETPSVHLRTFPDVPASWLNEELAARWQQIRGVRSAITGALELARAGKQIGSSLQASPVLYLTPQLEKELRGINFAEIAITSSLTVSVEQPPADATRADGVDGVAVLVQLADGLKCERCWQVLPEVGSHADHPHICDRCHDVVTHPASEAA